MAITEQDFLRIKMNDIPYLLLRSPTHFHLVQVNSELTDKRFRRLLHIYPCSTKELESMHLHVSAFKTENVTFIHLHKTHIESTLELHRTLSQVNCTISLEYSDTRVQRFFDGYSVTITSVPKPKVSKATIKRISKITHAISYICAAIYVFTPPRSNFAWPCIFCQFIPILLSIWKPTYFRINDFHWTRMERYKEEGNLLIAWLIPAITSTIRALTAYTYNNANLTKIFTLNFIAVLVMYILLLLLRPTFRLHIRKSIPIILLFILYSVGNFMHINYLTAPTPTAEYSAAVVSLERSNTRHKNYHCIAETKLGTAVELNIRGRDYYALSPDDQILIQYYDGALNIPFYIYKIP